MMMYDKHSYTSSTAMYSLFFTLVFWIYSFATLDIIDWKINLIKKNLKTTIVKTKYATKVRQYLDICQHPFYNNVTYMWWCWTFFIFQICSIDYWRWRLVYVCFLTLSSGASVSLGDGSKKWNNDKLVNVVCTTILKKVFV